MQATHMPPSAASVRTAAIPSLDGIRAVAVGLVFLAHSGLENVVPGGLGVTIFFVLSGYLITTLMRMEFSSTATFSYRRFYLRRFLRLMPPLVVVVIATGLLAAGGVIGGEFSHGGLPAVLFYYGNYFVIAHDFDGVPAGLGVVWSLAVEEHYYLLFPPLAVLLLRIGHRGLAAATLLALCMLVLGWRCWLVMHGVAEEYVTMATDTRVDAILSGCLLALWRNPWLEPPAPRSNARREVMLIVAALSALLFALVYRDDFFRHTWRYSLQSAAVAVLIYFAVARAALPPFRWLNTRPMIWIGTLSYTIYLSHHVILLAVNRHWPQLGGLWATVLAVALTLGFAEPMRRLVEEPCARLRRRLHRPTVARTATAHPIAQTTPTGAL
ncbi:MAG TPA: acyltransferase [Povalibacter sp.]|nr:acyltransferase [Povalibacter sp.]